jgi:hypothetical protein
MHEVLPEGTTNTYARSALIASAALSAILLTLVPVAAEAATPSPSPSPSLPAWYDTAEGPAYADSAPSAYVWTADSVAPEFLKVVYWLPGSGAPGPTQSDVEVTVISADSDTALISLSTSPFTSDIDLLVAGFALPQSSNNSLPVSATFDRAGDFTLTRPDAPSECNADDPSSYEDVQLAALGQTGIKYKITVDVTFAERIEDCDTSSPTPTPSHASEQSNESDESGGNDSTTTGSDEYFPAPEESRHEATPLTNAVGSMIVLGLALATAFVLYRRRHPAAASQATSSGLALPQWNHKGELIAGPSLAEWMAQS